MKKVFHFHFYSRIAIMAVLALVVFFLQYSANIEAQQIPNSVRLAGWAWSDQVGWVSLNCRNDFDGDGLIENTCASGGGVDYWLEVVDVSGEYHVQGCAWAGVSVDGNPGNVLGWICFNDWNGADTQAPTNGIRINDDIVNSLCFDTAGGVCNTSNSFASIANQEGQCNSGPFEGDPCNIDADCGGAAGSCVIQPDAWKLGFNIQDPVPVIDPDYPSDSNPLEGCFNCHIDRIAECTDNSAIDCSLDDALCDVDELRCAGNTNVSCTLATENADCYSAGNYDWRPCQETTINYGACIQTGQEEKCENCLEYFYYEEGDSDLYTNGYEHRRILTIDNNYVAGASNYNNFPVLVSLTLDDLRYFTSAGDVTSPNGYDIVFTQNADGTGQLDHEIEDYSSTTGAIRMWVRIPTLVAASDTTFYMFYGNNAINTSQEIGDVWSDGFEAVYHLGDNLDSTANSNDGTWNGSLPDNSLGAIGDGQHFDGVDDYLLVPHHGSISGLPAVSLSAWINVGAWSNNLGDINFLAAKSNWSSQREYRIRHQGSTGQVYWQVSDNGTNVAETTVDDSSISVGEWHYLTGTWQTGADNLIFYLDGVAVDTSTLTVASLFGGSADFAIGSSADGGSLDDRDDWDGYIDEVRVSSIVRSSDYIATEFSNQRYPGNFMTVGLDDPRAIGGLKYVIGGYSCELCTIEDTNNNCGTNPYNLNINRCEVCNDGVYYTPGLMIDHKYNNIDSIVDQVAGGCDINQTDPDMDDYCEVGYMCGWGWNAWQDAGVTQGLGWFQFGARINTSTRPYFTADKGSIYSRGSVFSRYNAPFGRYNASYLIESGGTITNIVSSTTLDDLYQGELANRPLLDFFNIKSNNKYTNALGTIDYLGLTKVSEQILGTDYNKYNSEIITNPISLTLSAPMDGKVIYFDDTYGNVTIDAYVEVPVGIDSGASLQMGSGVVVVAGNLHFNADVEYETISSPTNFNLKHIPSLVWIVKGSVTVSPDVSNLAGTFIALGSAGVAGECTPHLVNDEISHCIDEAYSLADLDHMCGQFVSCFDDGTATGDCSTNQLSVSGSVIARQFDLCRSYIDVGRPPAELFTNDGRLQANPPPGLVDFSKVIPRFSENLR